MSRFNEIDSKLKILTEELNAQLVKDRPEYPESLRTFEERRINWNEGNLKKSIIIQPSFEIDRVNSSLWNFRIIAWIEPELNNPRKSFKKNLIENKEFEEIENEIDDLLIKSIHQLSLIKLNHLK